MSNREAAAAITAEHRASIIELLGVLANEYPNGPFALLCKDTIAALSAPVAAQPAASGVDALWRPMKTAPKDGTIVRLLVDYRGDDACHPLEDAEITHTIGGNTDGNTGLREGWKFAGWSWEQDCFCEGRGKPIGWLPFDAVPLGVSAPDATALTGAAKEVKHG